MKISYKTGKDILIKNADDSTGFILSNKAGGYFSIPVTGKNTTKYHGAFFCQPIGQDWTLYKTIENVYHEGEIEEVNNNLWNIERKGKGFSEEFYMPYHHNVLVYKTKDIKEIELVLDMREIYDFSTIGRKYEIYKEENNIIVEYTKHGRENNEEYKIYLIIDSNTIEEYAETNEWEEVHYELDKYRRSGPGKWWTYKALKLKLKPESKIIFAYGPNKERAKQQAEYVKNNEEALAKAQKEYIRRLTDTKLQINNEEIRIAYKCTLKSLNDLLVIINGRRGIYAGLWWFHQWWSRDEAQSLNALIIQNKLSKTKEILFRELEIILDDGRVPNRHPASKLGSADGVGWVFTRLHNYITALEKKRKLDEYLSMVDILAIQQKLEESITKIRENYTDSNSLIINKSKETWMDTTTIDGKDDRAGARIEIQALMLSTYKLMQKISEITGNEKQKEKYKKIEKELAKRTKEKFWNGKTLLDGVEDKTARPNIFIAAYLYPELLTKKEWTSSIQETLKKTWCEWKIGGGISTIDKKSPLFHDTCTGENTDSYHRGDVWYHINNMAAVAMHRINPSAFKDYINKIVNSSTHSILSQGLLGHAPEISSAKQIESNGSPAQAWSEAFYIELINELYSKE